MRTRAKLCSLIFTFLAGPFIGSVGEASERFLPVSMIQLIANPVDYEGEAIAVHGWFAFYSIFPTREHALIHDLASSVDLIEPTDEGKMTVNCEDKYVIAYGTLSIVDTRPTITQVTRVYDIKGQKFCWKLDSP